MYGLKCDWDKIKTSLNSCFAIKEECSSVLVGTLLGFFAKKQQQQQQP